MTLQTTTHYDHKIYEERGRKSPRSIYEMRLEIIKLATEMKLKRYDYTTTLIKNMTPEMRQNWEMNKFPMFPTSDQIMKLARVIENFIYPEPKKTDKSEPVI